MAMKNKASDTINKITPKFNPFCTANVWSPKKVPSLIISLNQKDIDTITKNIPKYNK
jgi:ABC-type cobalt transport system substrate-binding protein